MHGPIVHLIWNLDVGGGELFLRDLARELQRRGVSQHICTIGPAGPLAEELRAAGIPVTAFEKRSRLGLVTVVRLAAHLRRLVPSIVHTHGEAGVFWGLPAARLAGTPAVSLVYQNYDETGAKMAVARRLLRWPTRVVAGSNDVARFMRDRLGVPAARLETIYCGIAPESFARIHPAATREHQPTIVSVGRLVTRKGHRTLIDALPEIRRRHPQAEVVIIGDGPCRGDLEARARQIGLAHAVRLPGTVYPTHEALAGASVFVFPSLAEPQGLALLEAFAAGVPVVASRTGGISEMLEHDVDGLLVPPGDPGALAAAVCRLLDEPAAARGMASHARGRLAPFHVATIADAYLRLYRDVASGRRMTRVASANPTPPAGHSEPRRS